MLAAREHRATRTASVHLGHHFAFGISFWNAAAALDVPEASNLNRCAANFRRENILSNVLNKKIYRCFARKNTQTELSKLSDTNANA